jgi:SAM-dependent methyltransferase
MNMNNSGLSIQRSWEDPDHLRLRIQPRYTDSEYFVFSDLNDFIKQNGSKKKLMILDFGAGSSPYKLYFPNADYRRADILDVPNLQYHIGQDGRIREQDGIFDLIVSTQVLEHVHDVHQYLIEANRLLKKNGRLLLTTHGVWEEHGVPYDFQRWTEEGMNRDLAAAGFSTVKIFKLTSGLRAALFIFIKGLFAAAPPRQWAAKLFFKSFRYTVSKTFPLLYRACDEFWPEEKIFQAGQLHVNNPSLYIIIAAIATKQA